MDESAITGYGGKRDRAGQKPRSYVEANPNIAAYNAARARKEAALADGRELDFKIQSGVFVSRVAVRQAAATALASLSQTLQSIPDNLERTLGVSPELAQEIAAQIDAALADLAVEFEAMSEQ